ncbi:MAG: hypothetical protein C5B59_06950 [Bacteroidetes bacterium]|nr:MAG: hypothetical protein C5B59_06950 [Bacteroidota bacterium]
MGDISVIPDQWRPWLRWLFRFFFIYFVFYTFPFPLDSFDFTAPIVKPYYDLLDWFIPRIGEKWFHTKATPVFPMFDKLDDSGYGLAFIYFNLILSLIGTICWSLLDRKRKNYHLLYQWLRLYLRFYLAAFLFGYGFIKIFPSQFQAPTASSLTSLVGDQTPMMLAWHFMGYSVVMMRINGIVEVLAGLLLLFRRTTTIGAILSSGVFSFVVLMDFCFNVPVRLLASHLLIISLFLIVDDGQKLANIFFLNKPTQPTSYPVLINNPGWRKAFLYLLAILGICLLFTTIFKAIDSEKSFGLKSPKVPLYGVYKTIYFIRNKDTVAPLATDSLRWKLLVIDGNSYNQSGIIQFNSDKRSAYTVKADTATGIISMQSRVDTTEKYSIHFEMQDDRRLHLMGRFKQDTVEILMDKYELDNYILHKEKFKWISDVE